MATITRFVNTDSSAGGDGTTNNTTGATRAYASLSEWNTAEAVDLVAAGDSHICECNGSAADTVGFVDLGVWTTGAANTLIIRMLAGQEHGGAWNTSAYRLVIARTFSAVISIQAGAEYVTIQGLQIENTGDTTQQSMGIRIQAASNLLSDVFLLGNLIRNTGPNTPTQDTAGIHVGGGSELNTTHVNNIIFGNWFDCLTMGFSDTGVKRLVYNNTLLDAVNNCLQMSSSEPTSSGRIFNNLCSGAGVADIGGILGTNGVSGTNVTSDGSSIDGGGFQNRTFSFVNPGALDYHLQSGDTGARGLATDLSADSDYPFNIDVDVQTRTVPWDCGADEFIVGDPPITLTNPTALNPTSTSVTPRVNADETGGTLYAYAVAGSGQTPNHATIVANAQSTAASAIGAVTMPDITGLASDSDFTLAFSAVDSALSASTPVYVDFSTLQLTAVVVLRSLTTGALIINTTDIEFAVWDEAGLDTIGVPVSQGVSSTDANGEMNIPYGSSVGQNGIVLARKVIAGADNTNDSWAAGGVLAE